MTWARAQCAIKEVFDTASGLYSVWDGATPEPTTQGLRAVLSIAPALNRRFFDDLTFDKYDADNKTVTAVVRGRRILRLTASVETGSPVLDGQNATWVALEEFVARLRMPGVLALLSSACVGLVRIGNVTTIRSTVAGREGTKSIVEVDFAIGIEVEDCPMPTIETVTVQTNVTTELTVGEE